MGVLERIENIIKANLNDLLTRTDNPVKILDQLILDMQVELAEARIQLSAAAREETRLKMLFTENQQLAEKWEKKAVFAIQLGRDDLAREAILRKRSALDLAKDYKQESEIHEEVLKSLNSSLIALESKIQEAKKRKDDLVIRKTQANIERLLGQSFESKLSMFKRMENKINSVNVGTQVLEEIGIDEVATKQREAELETELEKLKESLKSNKKTEY
jgi:phage shock protein A